MTVTHQPTALDLACIICRKPGPGLDIDHIVNRGMGGSKERDVPANKAPLCRPCHLAKTVGTIKTWVDDKLKGSYPGRIYCWRKRDSDLVFRIPVEISARYGCLVPCDGADDTDSHSSVQPSVPSQAGEGTPPRTPLVQIASVPSPALMNGEGAERGLSSNAAPLTPSPFSLTWDDWAEEGRCLRDEGEMLRQKTTEWCFRVGDWVNRGEQTFGESAHQLIDEVGLSYWNIAKYASIARRVPPENRLDARQNITLEHYKLAAQLPAESQAAFLSTAAKTGLSASRLKEQLEENGMLTPATRVGVLPEPTTDLFEIFLCPKCGHKGERPEFRQGGTDVNA